MGGTDLQCQIPSHSFFSLCLMFSFRAFAFRNVHLCCGEVCAYVYDNVRPRMFSSALQPCLALFQNCMMAN